jgi:drug/metabolite transporter (DMT)-like permease
MLIKYALEDFSPIEVAFFQASIGAIGLLAIVPFQGGRARAAMGDILRRPLPAILLGLLCTALTFMLYYQLIAEVGEERAALGNYLTPIFALIYGVILLGEPLTLVEVLGLVLIIVGAEITLRGDSAKRAGGEAKAHEYRPHPPFHA